MVVLKNDFISLGLHFLLCKVDHAAYCEDQALLTYMKV